MSSTPLLNNAVCRICLTEPTCPTATPCHHTFCYECITTHLSTRNVCPICSTFLTVQLLQSEPSPSLNNNANNNSSHNNNPSTPQIPSNASAPPAPNSTPPSERTPDITTSISSRRTAPPPLLRSYHPTRSLPSTQAARRRRAEAMVQATNVNTAPSHHLLSTPHHNIHSSFISGGQHTTANVSYLQSVSRRGVEQSESFQNKNTNVHPPTDTTQQLHRRQQMTLPIASTPPLNNESRKKALNSTTSTPNVSNANVLLAATENLSAEQLAGVIAQLNQKLHKKERSDRHIENHLLLHFLKHSRRQKETALRNIQSQLEILSADIHSTESQCLLQQQQHQIHSNLLHTNLPGLPNDDFDKSSIYDDVSFTRKRQRVVDNFDVLEDHYFNTVSKQQDNHQVHKTALKNFTDDVYKLTQFSKLKDCASLMHVTRVPGDAHGNDVFKASNIVSSMEFDRDSEFLATAGVTRKIKIFEFSNVSKNLPDVHYPIREIPTQAKLSWVCWNPYIRHHLLSSDYEGLLKIWDVNLATALSEYEEHEMRAWCVDYCPTKPAYFASGSDDGTVKIWTTTQRNSVITIDNKKANVCSVKFHPTSSHLLAFGSVDHNIKYYDLRYPSQPLQTFKSHARAVSYVKFMSDNELISASVDSTIKMWNLQDMSLTRTFSGHTNDKNFVGLSVTSDYIACGSEENKIYCYYKAVPKPLTDFKFSNIDPLTGEETQDDEETQFVSSVCWCPNDPTMLVAANSLGNMRVLRLQSEDDLDEDSEKQKDLRKRPRTDESSG